jgi:hypothetical protein
MVLMVSKVWCGVVVHVLASGSCCNVIWSEKKIQGRKIVQNECTDKDESVVPTASLASIESRYDLNF